MTRPVAPTRARSPATTLAGRLAAGLLLALASGCTVIAVTSAVVSTGVTVAGTAVGAAVAVGKGVVNVGAAVLGADDKPVAAAD